MIDLPVPNCGRCRYFAPSNTVNNTGLCLKTCNEALFCGLVNSGMVSINWRAIACGIRSKSDSCDLYRERESND